MSNLMVRLKGYLRLIFLVLVILMLLEVGLRLFWRMSGLKGEIYQTSANKILRYELRPNLKTTYESFEVVINSDGFRDKEYPLQKGRGVYRIVMLGDSTAFGRFVGPQENLPRRLEKALEKACPQKDFEVLNMGVEGYNSIQELELLKTKALKYNPDLVIVYYNFNDPDYPEYYFRKNLFTRNFLLARYIQYRIKKKLIKRDRKRRGVRSEEENFKYLYTTECWQHTKETISEMADLTAAKGIRLILLVVPELSQMVKDFREGYPYWYINEMLESLKHPNMIVISPVREFSRRNIRKEEIANWSYPNLSANDIIAEYTIHKLGENNIATCN